MKKQFYKNEKGDKRYEVKQLDRGGKKWIINATYFTGWGTETVDCIYRGKMFNSQEEVETALKRLADRVHFVFHEGE